MNCTPEALLQAAACYQCASKQVIRSSIIYLLCEWANHLEPTVECGTPSDVIVISGAGNAGANGTYIHNPTSTNIWNSVNDTNARIRVFGGTAFLEYGLAALELYTTPIADFPCIWTTGLDGTDPAPTGIYSAAPPFAWLPATEIATWTDGGGVHVGDLPNFQANADTATVSAITFGATSFLTAVVGIGNLPSLSSLDVHGNSLVSLDCSGSTSLTTLNCSSNASLTTLTLTGCTGLTSLNCNTCDITGTLNCSNLTSLSILYCYLNPNLAVLNLTGCSSLTQILCYECALTALNCSGLTSLSVLDCSYNSISSLNTTGCTSLFSVQVQSNLLTGAIDFSASTNINTVDCSVNSITSLDFTGCANLAALFCFTNSLTSLNISSSHVLNDLIANDNHFDTAAVNTILVDVDTLAGTYSSYIGFLDLSGQLPSGAPPDSGPPDGLTARANLIAAPKLWNVTTD